MGAGEDQQYAASGNAADNKDIKLISTDQELVFSRGKPGTDGDEDGDENLTSALDKAAKKTQKANVTDLLSGEGQDEAMPGGVAEASKGNKLFQKKGAAGPGRPSAVVAQPKDEKKVVVK